MIFQKEFNLNCTNFLPEYTKELHLVIVLVLVRQTCYSVSVSCYARLFLHWFYKSFNHPLCQNSFHIFYNSPNLIHLSNPSSDLSSGLRLLSFYPLPCLFIYDWKYSSSTVSTEISKALASTEACTSHSNSRSYN
jgi:hypothetical protein